MTARITVNGKDYRGRTIDSIIRREFGPKASLKKFADPNTVGVGEILLPARYGGFIVRGTVSYADEYKRTKPLSRQKRWDNACGKLQSAIDTAQEVADELEAESESEDEIPEDEKEVLTKDREERLASATSEFADGMSELQELRDEFQEWEDNLPEQFQYGNSPVSEKIQEIVNMYSIDESVEFELEEDEVTGIDDAQNILDEVEYAELPLGFGRD